MFHFCNPGILLPLFCQIISGNFVMLTATIWSRDMRYAIVVEKAGDNYSAYAPDLPGCIATGNTVKEAEQEIQAAIQFHIDGLREDGLPIPEPTNWLNI
jgi:predicted RNase H-like HicB family nuclease